VAILLRLISNCKRLNICGEKEGIFDWLRLIKLILDVHANHGWKCAIKYVWVRDIFSADPLCHNCLLGEVSSTNTFGPVEEYCRLNGTSISSHNWVSSYDQGSLVILELNFYYNSVQIRSCQNKKKETFLQWRITQIIAY